MVGPNLQSRRQPNHVLGKDNRNADHWNQSIALFVLSFSFSEHAVWTGAESLYSHHVLSTSNGPESEYRQLVNRANKLRKMIRQYEKGELEFEPDSPIDILVWQLKTMDEYIYILKRRASYEKITL